MLSHRWDDARAQGLSEPELLLYRSHLLGADPAITNFAGGNTSAKISMQDPITGDAVPVLWVKGSGSDLGSIDLGGFATLYQDKLLALEKIYRGRAHEDEMVLRLEYCTFAANARAPSIDTPLHAFLPYTHADHVHPDSIIAIASSRDGPQITNDVFGGSLGWLPWQRPGFDLGLRLRDLVRGHPRICGVILANHGLITWGANSRDCYRNTIETIASAEQWLQKRAGGVEAFGGRRVTACAPAQRSEIASRMMPVLRGKLSTQQRKVGHFSDDELILEFVNSARIGKLAKMGTSCPDHFLRTKIRPLVLPDNPSLAISTAGELITNYQSEYTASYNRNRRSDSPPMRDPAPVILLMPQVGMFAFSGDKTEARIAADFYHNAVRAMRGASAISDYVGLSERDAFDIEYWALEDAKLRRRPVPKALAGRIAIVTGGAGGIGRAVTIRLLADDACVALLDLDASALDEARDSLAERFAKERVLPIRCDVTDEASVANAFALVAREFGGVDIVVSNAGIASAAAIEETSLEVWNRNQSVLATGYFLVAREAARLLKAQDLGGSIVFVGSKNALAASAGAAAYNTAKAAELHLARSLALELAPARIRVNTVNPDAVLQGSRIWSSSWRSARAAAYKIDESDLERFYRERSLLKQNVLPEDVAEAVHFFASDRSAKSTGNVINVDAGNAAAFPR